jgi:hypothetical protein
LVEDALEVSVEAPITVWGLVADVIATVPGPLREYGVPTDDEGALDVAENAIPVLNEPREVVQATRRL